MNLNTHDLGAAKRQAQMNADWFKTAYGIFIPVNQTTLHCERVNDSAQYKYLAVLQPRPMWIAKNPATGLYWSDRGTFSGVTTAAALATRFHEEQTLSGHADAVQLPAGFIWEIAP